MDESVEDTERQFVQAQQSFGVSLLRQARQQATEPTPETEGQHPDTRLAAAANEAFERLLEHVAALPEAKQAEALPMVAYGMILEHLRLAAWTPRLWQRS
jgi:hypothetical protein